MKIIKITAIAIIAIITASIVFAVSTKKPTFQEYIAGVKKEAISSGISSKTVNKYLTHLKPPAPPKKSPVIQLQRHQAQAILTFKAHKEFITRSKLPYARKQYQKHLKLLKRIQKVFHVPPEIIVSLWGIESDYGRDMGNFPLVRSLAVLAYNHHRSKFYRGQLIDALIMLDRPKVIPEQLKSAWDGGMGQAQFEPSSYLHYAVDFNKDGFKNIWTSLPDVFASIANFLHQNGWNGKQTWGIPVKLPKNFPVKQAGRSFKYTNKHWQKLGVKQKNGKALPPVTGKTAILIPDGIKGSAYLVYSNFKVLLRWNNTTFEGLSTGILSDKIARKYPHSKLRDIHRSKTRKLS